MYVLKIFVEKDVFGYCVRLVGDSFMGQTIKSLSSPTKLEHRTAICLGLGLGSKESTDHQVPWEYE